MIENRHMYRHRGVRTWFYIKKNVSGPEWQDRDASGGWGGPCREEETIEMSLGKWLRHSLASEIKERAYFVLCTVLGTGDSGQKNKQGLCLHGAYTPMWPYMSCWATEG